MSNFKNLPSSETSTGLAFSVFMAAIKELEDVLVKDMTDSDRADTYISVSPSLNVDVTLGAEVSVKFERGSDTKTFTSTSRIHDTNGKLDIEKSYALSLEDVTDSIIRYLGNL